MTTGFITIDESIRQTAVKAQEKKLGRQCPSCKQYPFYYPHGTAVCQGHVYSMAGKSELGMSGYCEFCFDAIEPEDERALRTGGQQVEGIPHDLPLEGQVLQTVTNLDDYDVQSGRFDTGDKEDAQVITSLVRKDIGSRTHKVVIDLDLPAQPIPSSTEGHFHLYIDHEMEEDVYMELLTALGKAGLVEPGYVRASHERKLTAVRLPWIHKPTPPEDEDDPEDDDVELLMDETAKASFATPTPDPWPEPEPVCTCGPGKELVTRMLDAEPHFAGCPRWGTKLPDPKPF